MQPQDIISEVVSIIKTRLPQGYKILLFGSWARGDALSTSDIDIGILGRERVPWEVMTQILESAGEIPTLRTIDIVDLLGKEEAFRKNVLKYAKLLN